MQPLVDSFFQSVIVTQHKPVLAMGMETWRQSVGGVSPGPICFMQGCIASLECVQHEYDPPGLLHKPRMSQCILGSIRHHLRVFSCITLFMLAATYCTGITSELHFTRNK